MLTLNKSRTMVLPHVSRHQPGLTGSHPRQRGPLALRVNTCRRGGMRSFRLAVVLGFLLLPAATYAQSSLAGAVKDTSGAVLPGVTVEAASPALIEKVRSVATDATGQYKIVDLRPGTYTVTFSLPGFSVVRREGVELSGSGTVQLNADLKVGALEET